MNIRGRVNVVQAEELARPHIERRDEAGLAGDQEDYHDDREADQAAVEAPLLHPGVARHTDRDQHPGQHDRDQRHHEDAVVGGEPGRRAGVAGGGPQRLEELLAQHRPVDRRPEPHDEPPPGGGHHEAEPAAQDAALPDVVTTGPGGSDDETGVGDDEERDPHPRDEDRVQQVALRERKLEGPLDHAQRHHVGGQAGVDHGVPDGPAPDQAGRVAEEESRSLFAQCPCRHMYPPVIQRGSPQTVEGSS